MLSEITSNSSIISIHTENVNEEDKTYTGIVRVLNPVKWQKMIHKILMTSQEVETFGASIKQEYYLNDQGSPSFIWSLLLWGDLEDATTHLSPIVGKRGGPPAPPKTLNITPTEIHRVQRGDGSVVSSVSLPHKRGARQGDPDETVKVNDRRNVKTKAIVRTVGS